MLKGIGLKAMRNISTGYKAARGGEHENITANGILRPPFPDIRDVYAFRHIGRI